MRVVMRDIAAAGASLLLAASLGANAARALAEPSLAMIPAALAGWYLADLASGLVHMVMDYHPCPAGRGLGRLYTYPGSRESEEYRSLFAQTMRGLTPFQRLAYDFKNHHPRPMALGRRSMWRQVGSTVIVGTLPASILLNLAWLFGDPPGWAVLGLTVMLVGATFAQYFHGSLHRQANPPAIRLMRRLGLLMSPEAHQIHHDTLQRDFATNCGWSNPLLNRLFRFVRSRGGFPDEGLEPRA